MTYLQRLSNFDGLPICFRNQIAHLMENASQAILSLRPVTFHYKTDTNDIPRFDCRGSGESDSCSGAA
jgi:hypothetical protein